MTLFLAILSITQATIFARESSFQETKALKMQLQALVTRGHKSVGYDRAKALMFKKIDNHDGEVCSVYSPSECIITRKIPNNNIMNTEHTWPKSRGAKGNPAVADLHHLYPTTSRINSIRSSLPFCDVEEVDWEFDGSKRGTDKYGTKCFEPPNLHKGNVARAIFYFSVRYNMQIDKHQEDTLRRWHIQDPVNAEDIARNERVKSYQHNTNIFVERPELVQEVEDF